MSMEFVLKRIVGVFNAVSANNRFEEVQMGNDVRSQDSSSKSVALEVGSIGMEIDEHGLFDNENVSLEDGNVGMETDEQDLLDNKGEKCIGQGQMKLEISDSSVLNRCMFHEEDLKEVQDYVKKVKDSWAFTGCSILLDAWVDQRGRELVAFVADSPAGPVYLKSLDVKINISALISRIDELVDEVGTDNVVQIIGCSSSGWVGELGEYFTGNKKGIFWSVSVSHCFELMLVKIAKLYFVGDVGDKVNKITVYINNNPSVLKLVEAHSHGIDTTAFSSEFEFVMPYLTLESIFKAKNDLVHMFAASDWTKEEDMTISNLVNDSSFWETVERVVKCSSLLIRGLLLFTTGNNQHVAYIYDTIDCIKESIARDFNDKKVYYMPLWDVIDDVWNEHLHIPLHAAGYYLNPIAFYSKDFHLDPEVASGLISSLVHLVKDCDIQVKVAKQLDMYRLGQGCFNEASQADQISGVSPAEWWSEKASEHPELQSFAIKILSQTCEGASRYKLKRNLAEKLLFTGERSHYEQHVEELAFVHYNLHLQNYKAKVSEEH